MSQKRFDVVYGPGIGQVDIQPHFCREWDGDEGCYGTNPHHGMTFDDAREEVAKYYRERAEHWDAITYEMWIAENVPSEVNENGR